MSIAKHNELLAEAQQLTKDNPELHAEYTRRRKAGEWFRDGEPVTTYMRRLHALNEAALKAVDE